MENEQEKKNRTNAVRFLWIAGIVLVIVLLYINKDMENIKVFIRNHGTIGLIVSVGLYGLLGLSPIPSEPLTILISTLFGPLEATLVAGTGNLLAAVVEYYLGRKLGDASDFKAKKEKLPFGLGKLPVNSVLFLLGARMIPGYGPKLVSVLGGLYHVPILRYIWTAAIPTFAGAAIFAYGGFGLLGKM